VENPAGGGPSQIPLQLPLAPVRLFAIGIELPHHAAVERLQYTDARQLESGAAGLCGPEQVLDRDLPYLEIMFCPWQLGDVGRGIPERHELPAVG
jgi:hypothetical protein